MNIQDALQLLDELLRSGATVPVRIQNEEGMIVAYFGNASGTGETLHEAIVELAQDLGSVSTEDS